MTADLDALYATLPALECRGLCGPQVCGPIPMTVLEFERVRHATLTTPAHRPDGHCRYFGPTGCSVYALRPLICRVYGLQEAFRCAHGCVPSRWLSDDEARDVTVKVNRLSDHQCVRPMALKERT